MYILRDRKNRNITFRFMDPDTAYDYSVKYRTFDDLLQHIRAYRRINKLPEVPNLDDVVDMYVASLPQNKDYRVEVADNKVISPGKYIKGAYALANQLIEKYILDKEDVSKEVASSRASICVQCPFNTRGIKDFNLYETFARKIMSSVVKYHQTSYHAHLGMCSICQCDLSTKVYYSKEAIIPTLTEDEKMRLPNNNIPSIQKKLFKCWQLP